MILFSRKQAIKKITFFNIVIPLTIKALFVGLWKIKTPLNNLCQMTSSPLYAGEIWISQHVLEFFFCPTLVSCWLIHLHISLPSLKFTIFINLSPIIVFDVINLIRVAISKFGTQNGDWSTIQPFPKVLKRINSF